MYDLAKIYILSPSIRFRRETHRCIGYSIDDFFHSPDNLTVLHPDEVIFLLLFDGTRTILQVEKDFDYLYENQRCPWQRISGLAVLETLEKRMHLINLIVPLDSVSYDTIRTITNRYDPMDFLIPESDIKTDYADLRLEKPLSVNFNLMTTCGFRCLYCYHPLIPIPEQISLQRLQVLFKELHDIGCESVLLTGGDPMLRQDVDEVMIALHTSEVFYTLSTKSIIPDSRLQKLHEEAGLDRMQLSIDSCDRDIISTLIGADTDYLDRFACMVKAMQVLGIDVRVKAVLTSYNADNLDEYFQYIDSLGIRHIQIVGYGRSGVRHRDEFYPSYEQQQRASEIVSRWQSDHTEIEIVGGGYSEVYDEPCHLETIDTNTIFSKRTICNAGRFAMTWLPNGEVYICEHLPYDTEYVLGDLRTESIMECWNGDRMKQWLSPPPRDIFALESPCRKCSEPTYSICHTRYSRCLRFARELTGTTRSPDPRCPYAEFKKTRLT